MREADRFRSELERIVGKAGSVSDLETIHKFFIRQFPKIPKNTVEGLYSSFISRWGKTETARRKALDWLGASSSLLDMDFDETILSKEDWMELREIVTPDSGEMDLEILSYIMARIVENGAV